MSKILVSAETNCHLHSTKGNQNYTIQSKLLYYRNLHCPLSLEACKCGLDSMSRGKNLHPKLPFEFYIMFVNSYNVETCFALYNFGFLS